MKISHVSKGVILNPSVVTLNASYVILNEVKNLSAGSVKSLRVNSVKDLRWFRDSSPPAQNDITYPTDFGNTTLATIPESQKRACPNEGPLLNRERRKDKGGSKMAWIKTLEENEAKGLLRLVYGFARWSRGRVPNIVKISSLHPHLLMALGPLFRTIMEGPSPLTRAQRKMVAIVASKVNNCFY